MTNVKAIAMQELSYPIRKSVERLSQIPIAFDFLRWILEAGFVNHRKLIAQHFPNPPAHVLDCGCGTGIYANCFPESSYTGIDLSAKYIARARKCQPKYRFEVMNAMSLRFANETFDAVIISGVLHHLPPSESRKVLTEAARVLQPGGKLLVWEDIPTRSRWNVVGHLVHQLDVGEHIQEASGYEELLSPQFAVEHVEPMRSGFMDYITLAARKSSGRSGASNRLVASTVTRPASRPAPVNHDVELALQNSSSGQTE